MIIKAIKYSDTVGFIFRKELNSVRNTVWNNLIVLLKDWGLYDHCKVNISNYEVTLPNGAFITCKGLDDIEKIKGIMATDVIIDEVTSVLETDYDEMQVRLRGKFSRAKQLTVCMNPVSKANWTYKKWFDKDSIITNDTKVIHSTFRDNKFLSDADKLMYDNLKLTNFNKWQTMANGLFVSQDKLIYENYRVEEFDEQVLRKEGHLTYFGLDYGFANDESAFVKVIVDQLENKMYICDEMYERAMTNREIAKWIMKRGYARELIIADSQNPKDNYELRKLGISRLKPSVKGKDSVLNGIQFIQNFELIIHPDCVNFLNEVENYAWKKDKSTGEYTNKPIDRYNHLLDALRYCTRELMPKGRLRTVNKKLFGL